MTIPMPGGDRMDQQKKYYPISEVSDMLELKAHILRYWETEFTQLKPRKNRAGNRAYTGRDIEVARRIKELLYDEKYTIEGARQRLKQKDGADDGDDDQLALTFGGQDGMPEGLRVELTAIRRDVADLLNRVERL